MDKDRNQLLGDIRAALGRGPVDLEQARLARAQMWEEQGPARPHWEERAEERFVSQMEKASGSVARVSDTERIPQAVQEYMARHGLAEYACLADHPRLARLEWPFRVDTFTSTTSAQADLGVAVAAAAVAETGSLVMLSGARSPVSLNFLPERLVAVVESERIVPNMEALWASLHEKDGFPPRVVNMITGPSRTADVEQRLQIGAHGPKALHVILVNNGGGR